ncbi:transposase [Bacteroidia bacterium]|nr:transposase [Bacteroidia bacterium]
MDANILEIYYMADEFSKKFDGVMEGHRLAKKNSKPHRNRKFIMSDSEVTAIVIMFHLKHFRHLKAFYTQYIQVHCKEGFPQMASYNRFVELQQKVAVKLSLFLQLCCLGKCSGISFIDSTPLRACHIKREHNHKVFKGLATKGKSSMGWFFGFKLHLVINDKGEIFDFLITQANVDDREPLKNKRFHGKLSGKIFAGRGYVSQDLSGKLFVDGIHLITRLKKNMKNSPMPVRDKICLRKRSLIEAVNDGLKNICRVEHTRHRSFENFTGNMVAVLVAYNFLPKKPSLNLDIIDMNGLQRIA